MTHCVYFYKFEILGIKLSHTYYYITYSFKFPYSKGRFSIMENNIKKSVTLAYWLVLIVLLLFEHPAGKF